MRHLLLFLFLLCSLLSHGQSGTLSGKVMDTVEHKILTNAVVSLIHPGDSVLVRFTRADANGNFKIEAGTGKYILMITHPYFADYVDNIELTGDQKLAPVYLTSKSKLLQEVIIKSGSPIRIKGDTTEYTADSFKVRANANVEDLLKKLPGIQVDKDGKITAMGEKVTKVLVDGEEFFGDDPGIATKNIRADAVDKVQVFDKKSDQAAFTGIDDGKTDKTINIKLKDSKKNGYFGKAELGGGLPGYYNNLVMANVFKKKRKLSGYGIMSNTGKTQLDWEDAQNYSNDGVQTEFDDADGGMMMFYGGNDDDSYYGGKNGIPTNWNGGLHYSDKSANGKQSINSGYKFARVNSNGETRVFSNTFLPDTSWITNSTTNTFNNSAKHAFNVTYEVNIDSFNTLKYTAKANTKHVQSAKDFYSESLNNDGDFINTSNQKNTNATDNRAFNNTLLYKHKFKKKFRTLSMNVTYDWIDNKGDGILKSGTYFYVNNIISHLDSLDQENLGDNRSTSLTSKLAYTEPLFKDAYMEFSYSFNMYKNRNEKITKQGINGKYENIIDTLTNTYEFNRMTNTPGINFRYNKKKINYSLGTGIGINSYEQENITTHTSISTTPITYMPRASINYKIKGNSTGLRLNYSGNSKAPALEQVQAIKTNTDPLNIYEGNPDLKQSFTHSISLMYNRWNVLKQTYNWSSINFTPVQNAFVNYSSIDTNGVRHYKTVNVNGTYGVSFTMNYGFKWKKPDISLQLNPVISSNRRIDFVNSIKNITDIRSYALAFYMGKEKEKKYSISINPRFSFNQSLSSINPAANINYWQLSGWVSGSVYLPYSFELFMDNNFEARQKDPRFPVSANKVKTNAGIKKNFFKDKLETSFIVNDIFNQNIGFDRNFGSYNYTETHYTTLQRYAMLSVTWNFNSKGAKPAGF
jgi:hypothetical protein